MLNTTTKIMIADSDAAVRDTCVSVAERMGASVYTTAYIDDFPLLVPQLLPDVVVLDVDMLRSGGPYLTGFLADCLLPMNIILMSQAGDRADALAASLSRSIAVDSVSVIHKPTDQTLLARRLEIRLSALTGQRESMPSRTARPETPVAELNLVASAQ